MLPLRALEIVFLRACDREQCVVCIFFFFAWFSLLFDFFFFDSLIFFSFCSLTSMGCGFDLSLSGSATVVVCVGFALVLRG